MSILFKKRSIFRFGSEMHLGAIVGTLVLFFALFAIPAVSMAGNDKGGLYAAFHTQNTADFTILLDGSFSAIVNSAVLFPNKINPLRPDQQFCSNVALGSWVGLAGPPVEDDPAGHTLLAQLFESINTYNAVMILDGIVLPTTQSGARILSPEAVKALSGENPSTLMALTMTVGVPEIDSSLLTVGTHSLYTLISGVNLGEPEILGPFNITFDIVDCP